MDVLAQGICGIVIFILIWSMACCVSESTGLHTGLRARHGLGTYASTNISCVISGLMNKSASEMKRYPMTIAAITDTTERFAKFKQNEHRHLPMPPLVDAGKSDTSR